MKLKKRRFESGWMIRALVYVLERIRRRKRLLFSTAGFDEPRNTRNLFGPESFSSIEIYSREASASNPALTRVEIEKFKNKGWVGTYPLLTPRGGRLLLSVHDRTRGRFAGLRTDSAGSGDPPPPWFKSQHAYISEFYDVARHPAIVGRVASLLGPDILAWSFTINSYFPGKVHPWHVDVEHLRWPGVSVFLGLRNITIKSTLKVISGSQRIRQLPEEFGVVDDESALAACLKFVPDAELVRVPIREGEFFIFDGPIWHGSQNMSFKLRSAAIIQYCRPDQKITAPINYGRSVQWHPVPPPCILVRGEDRWGINRLVGRP